MVFSLLSEEDKS